MGRAASIGLGSPPSLGAAVHRHQLQMRTLDNRWEDFDNCPDSSHPQLLL